MKKSNQNNQSSISLEQAQSIDWQQQFPLIVETLLKGVKSSYNSESQSFAGCNCGTASSDVRFRGSNSETIDDYSSVTPQIQKQFESTLCELYSSKRSMDEILDVLEKEHDKHYTVDQLYLAVERATPNYRVWRSHGLDNVYPMIWVCPRRFKVVDEKGVFTNHIMYTLLCVDQDGHKDVAGAWIPRKESPAFWVTVFTELKNRGVSDIIFLAGSNIEGLREATKAVYPNTTVIPNAALTLINLTKYVLSKDCPKFSQDTRRLWNQKDIDQARMELSNIEDSWGKVYPIVVGKIKSIWDDVAVFYELDNELRQFLVSRDSFAKLYDSLKRSFARKGFLPSDEAALRLAYLSISKLKTKWTAPFMNWGKVNQSIALTFGERYPLF